MMLLVIAQLLLTATTCLIDGELHGGSDSISIHDNLAIHVSGCTSCRLRQTAMTPQKALLISIDDGYQ